MIQLFTNSTYTVKLKWTAGVPAALGTITVLGNVSQIGPTTLLDPSTLQIKTGSGLGPVVIVVQAPDHMSYAMTVANVAPPPVPPPSMVAFDEATLVQTA